VRHIPIHTFQPSAQWVERARAATAELLAKATVAERRDYINAHGQVWKDLGAEFRAHFGNKCWYTDAANYGARLDVEHFRPKLQTVELSAQDCAEADDNMLLKLPNRVREGYWWLAFDPENLLLCAQVMNREEKRNFFPFHSGSPVADSNHKHVWRNEIPVFLDPRRLDDVCLVTYDERGAMRPRSDVTGWDRLRVVVTNECFGLSRFQPLVEGRQQVWQRCAEFIQKYMAAKQREINDGVPTPALAQEKHEALTALQRMLAPNEPFCSVVASCLRNSPYQWAQALATQPAVQMPQPQAVPNPN